MSTALARIPDGSWVSPDGRWIWRDGQWMPVPPGTGRPGLFWFISTPGWLQAILIMGLISLIPIVGVMNINGYAIVTSRNLKAGYRVLPPPGFEYLGLGAPLLVLNLIWSLVATLVAAIVGGAVALATYGATHDWAWTVAYGAGTGITVLVLLSIPMLPLLTPALEMSGRERWAILNVPRLVRHTLDHWRSAWYGVALFLVWYAVYFGVAMIASFVPFGSFLAVIIAMPLQPAILAVALARFDDPPEGFGRGAANALAVGWLAVWLLSLAVLWAGGLTAARIVSSHPTEVQCFFQPACNFAYSGDLETIARVHRNADDRALVMVDVTFINHSSRPATVNPADYSARTPAGADLAPTKECPLPDAAVVAPGQRLEQRVCFRLGDASDQFEVHLPWTGWDLKTD